MLLNPLTGGLLIVYLGNKIWVLKFYLVNRIRGCTCLATCRIPCVKLKGKKLIQNEVGGHLAGSVGRACDS